jgi:integrase
MKLTKRAVDQLEPKAGDYFVWDTDPKGFGVRVWPTGFKTWIVAYRPGAAGRNTQKRRLTLGSTATLTPDEARRAAREQLAGVRLGSDPAGQRRADRAIPTLSQLIDAYMSDEVKPKRAKGTSALYGIYFDKHVKGELGSRKATEITHNDVARLHREIGSDRKPTANRVVKALSGVFGYGSKHGKTPAGLNPTKGIELFSEEGHERYLTTDEMQRLGAALHEGETIGLPWQIDETTLNAKHAPKAENRLEVLSPYVTGAIRLLFTGCRLREILHLRWEDIDSERGLLFLPTSKTGKKTIVLNAPALEVLTTLPRAGAYVIAGTDPEKPRADIKRPWARITQRAGLAGVRIHDLRHSFASIGAGAGTGLPLVGKLLGHAQSSTTAKYAHLDADPLRRASEGISRQIANALSGKLKSEVLTLERGRKA